MTETADQAVEQTGESTETERKRAPAANFLPIVRGRFPLLLVHAVRFDEVLGKIGNKELAGKLATSIGKIFDVRKGRNFAYLTKDWKPSASDVSDAKAWAEQVGGTNAKGLAAVGDKDLILKLVSQYEGSGLATAEETAAFTASKPKSAFGAKKEGGEAKPLPAAAPASKAGNADDLLA